MPMVMYPANKMMLESAFCVLTLLGNLEYYFVMLIFFKSTFTAKFFQEYHQSVKQFGSRSGRTFYWA